MSSVTLNQSRNLRAYGLANLEAYCAREDLEYVDIAWLLCNAEAIHHEAGHTAALFRAAQACREGMLIAANEMQQALFRVARYDSRERAAQLTAVRQLVATEDAWSFGTSALFPSVRIEVLAAAALAGSRVATVRWLKLVLRDPESVADLVLDLPAVERELFVTMGPQWPGSTSELLSYVRSVMAPAA